MTNTEYIPHVALSSTVNTLLYPSIIDMNPVKIEKKLGVDDYKSMKKLLNTNIYDKTIQKLEADKKKNIEKIFVKGKKK